MKYLILIVFLIFVSLTNFAYAEPILTTLSAGVEKIVFDGKWSNDLEWKATSLTETIYDDGNKIVIRTGHDYENLYVLVDFITDTSIQKFNDKAVVCIDSNTKQNIKPDSNTYCFINIQGSKVSFTYQGGYDFASTGFFKTVDNHPDLITKSNISDENDRYSKIPHASYEFKIPIEIFGRDNIYKFFVSVTDGKTGQQYNWPVSSISQKYPFISSPMTWGELISPDKSIPEFSIPFYILMITIITSMVFSKIKMHKILFK